MEIETETVEETVEITDPHVEKTEDQEIATTEKKRISRRTPNRAIKTDRQTRTTEKADDQEKEKEEAATKPVPPINKEMIILEIPEEVTKGKTSPQTKKWKSHPD